MCGKEEGEGRGRAKEGPGRQGGTFCLVYFLGRPRLGLALVSIYIFVFYKKKQAEFEGRKKPKNGRSKTRKTPLISVQYPVIELYFKYF